MNFVDEFEFVQMLVIKSNGMIRRLGVLLSAFLDLITRDVFFRIVNGNS